MEPAKPAPAAPVPATKAVVEGEFAKLLSAERADILSRRAAVHRLGLSKGAEVAADNVVAKDMQDTVGLCCSGGGIRAAAFTLGAIQSLQAYGAFDRIDYLSTVSGGGYAGASYVATQQPSNAAETPKDPRRRGAFLCDNTHADTPAAAHIRDYANYLMPHGSIDLLVSAAIVLRGLLVNLATVGSVVLSCVLLTLWRCGYFCGRPIPSQGSYSLTLLGLWANFAFLILWAFLRGLRNKRPREEDGELSDWPAQLAPCLLIFTAVAFVVELQPHILNAMAGTGTTETGWVHDLIVKATYVLTSITGAVTLLRGWFADVLKEGSTDASRVSTLFARAVVVLAGIVLPLLIWLAYLNISHLAFHHIIRQHHIWQAWGLCLAITLIISDPNATTLHRLYRDRLSKTFLFDPLRRKGEDISTYSLDAFAPDLDTRDGLRLSDLKADASPYLLINAALNLQGSQVSNRRGRDADFFIFSRNFVGSDVTGYVPTKEMEEHDNVLDLATAMAISGAAVSSNMGSQSIKPLTLTMALLNLRLGYWAVNPAKLLNRISDPEMSAAKQWWNWFRTRPFVDQNLHGYFIAETLRLVDEDSARIYLTDGGHIENLGLYQLLKRKCKLIIVLDAEADPAFSFSALTIAERYARIDLGFTIDLPWDKIRETSLRVDRACAGEKDAPDLADISGPHCAIGVVHYAENQKGLLVYVKASLTGDESDYVMNYKKRNPAFPQETTADQFFSEEQFEAYRWLGFHAVQNLFVDHREVASSTEYDLTGNGEDSGLKKVLSILGVHARVAEEKRHRNIRPRQHKNPVPPASPAPASQSAETQGQDAKTQGEAVPAGS